MTSDDAARYTPPSVLMSYWPPVTRGISYRLLGPSMIDRFQAKPDVAKLGDLESVVAMHLNIIGRNPATSAVKTAHRAAISLPSDRRCQIPR